MSKESYLKGEEKLKAISVIKTGLGVRMSTKEVLQELSKRGIDISDRTYRRLKLEVLNNGGTKVSEIIQKNIGGKIFEQLLQFEEMERRCWELFYSAKISSEKFRAMSQLRIISQDKMKLVTRYPYRGQTLDYTKTHDDLAEFGTEGDDKTLES